MSYTTPRLRWPPSSRAIARHHRVTTDVLILGSSNRQERFVLVDKGRINSLSVTAQVELKKDYLRLVRGRSMAFSRRELGTGDFHIEAELCIVDKTSRFELEAARGRYVPNPAFLFSGGSSWLNGEIGLRSSAYIPPPVRCYNAFAFTTSGYFRFRGPVIQNYQKDIIRKHNPIHDGQYFCFEARRSGNSLSFIVDKEEIYTIQYTAETFGKFGFSGLADFEIDLRSFVATGVFTEWEPPPMLSDWGEGYDVPVIDLTTDPDRRTVVAGGEDVFSYAQGDERFDTSEGFQHPNTLLLDDDRTMLCAFTVGHGGRCGPLRMSRDAGLTWGWVPTPKQWNDVANCPTIHQLTDAKGVSRLFIYAVGSDRTMVQAVSVDGGETWSDFSENGLVCIVPPMCVRSISGGRHLMLFDNLGEIIEQAISRDGGLTWGPQRTIADSPLSLSEPCVIPSPDGRQLLAILRENSFWYNSQAITSDDEGETWSEPFELPGALTGHRHNALYDDNGRIVMVFRDMARFTKTPADFVGWVGTYDDIVNRREGQYRIRLIDNSTYAPEEPGFTGYAGLERRSDGTFIATTYAVISPGNAASIVATRFKLSEADELYRAGRVM